MDKPLLAISIPFLAVALAAAQDSPARSLQIRVSSTHRAYACQGDGVDAVQVTGSSDVLIITGHCATLQVTGSNDIITVDSVISLQFTGNSDTVLWRSAKPTTVDDHGQSNSVARATGQITTPHGNQVSSDDETSVSASGNGAAAASGSAGAMVSSAQQTTDSASQTVASMAGTVQGVQIKGNMINIILSKQRTTQDCGDGRTVNINGYQNEITLTGSCSKVTLNGWGNTIHIAEVTSIEIMGHTNTLTWERGRNIRKPVVQIDSGTDNSVRQITRAGQ
jgi:hypothetical protein